MRTIILIFMALMIYLIQPYFKISSFKYNSEDNLKDILYLYGFETKSDEGKEYICQYRCNSISINNLKDSCTTYYIEAKNSNLDDITLNIVKNPLDFWGIKGKTFTLKNIKDLMNIEPIRQEDTQSFCTFLPYDKENSKYFIKIYNNSNDNYYFYNQDIFLSKQNSSNTAWDKYSVSIYSKNIKDTVMYHYKKRTDSFILIGIVNFPKDMVDDFYTWRGSIEDDESMKANARLAEKITQLSCPNLYDTKDILTGDNIKIENIIKRMDLYNNLSYFGLDIEDFIGNFTDPCLYGLAYGDCFVPPNNISETTKNICVKTVIPLKEEGPLHFINSANDIIISDSEGNKIKTLEIDDK